MKPWNPHRPADNLTLSAVPFGAGLRTLDDLLARAEKYADSSMRGAGHLAPTLFMLGIEGPQMLTASCLDTEAAKDSFVEAARLLTVAQAGTATVMVMEAWATIARPGQSLDSATPPSESPDRQELVLLMGEALGRQQQKILSIIRTGPGQFSGFGDLPLPQIDAVKGRFAELLPSEPVSIEQRSLAGTILRAIGIVPGPHIAAGRGHRFRM